MRNSNPELTTSVAVNKARVKNPARGVVINIGGKAAPGLENRRAPEIIGSVKTGTFTPSVSVATTPSVTTVIHQPPHELLAHADQIILSFHPRVSAFIRGYKFRE